MDCKCGDRRAWVCVECVARAYPRVGKKGIDMDCLCGGRGGSGGCGRPIAQCCPIQIAQCDFTYDRRGRSLGHKLREICSRHIHRDVRYGLAVGELDCHSIVIKVVFDDAPRNYPGWDCGWSSSYYDPGT